MTTESVYVCITTNQPDTKSNPNPTTKQTAMVGIQRNIVACPVCIHINSYETMSLHRFLLLSVVIFTFFLPLSAFPSPLPSVSPTASFVSPSRSFSLLLPYIPPKNPARGHTEFCHMAIGNLSQKKCHLRPSESM